MLRDNIAEYTALTGENGKTVSLERLRAYLEGYDRGIETVNQIKTEIEELPTSIGIYSRDGLSCYGSKPISIDTFKENIFKILDKYTES